MKTITLCFCLFFSTLLFSQAQKPFEVKASLGVLSQSLISEENAIGESTFHFNIFGKPEIVSNGVYSGSFLYTFPNNRIQIGMSFFYEQVKKYYVPALFNFGGTDPEQYHVIYKRNAIGLMPSVYYNSIIKSKIRLYSGVAAGPAFIQKTFYDDAKSQYKSTVLSYQLTAAGFEFGKTIFGFAELGYGYKGIVNMGLAAKF